MSSNTNDDDVAPCRMTQFKGIVTTSPYYFPITYHPSFYCTAPCVAEELRQIGYKNVIEPSITTFQDGEYRIEANKLRGIKTIVFINSLKRGHMDDIFGQTLMTINLFKHAGIERVYVVLPYFAFCRQDRTDGYVTCNGAKVVAELFNDRVIKGLILVDPHAASAENFFNVNTTVISRKKIFESLLTQTIKPHVVISPDSGALKQNAAIATHLKAKALNFDKVRRRDGEVELSHGLEGLHLLTNAMSVKVNKYTEDIDVLDQMEDLPSDSSIIKCDSANSFADFQNELGCGTILEKVKDVIDTRTSFYPAVIIDDIVSTGGTLLKVAKELPSATSFGGLHVVCTHAVLAGDAIQKLNDSENIAAVYLSNTIEIGEELPPKFKIISFVPAMLDTLKIMMGRSVNWSVQPGEIEIYNHDE